MKIRRHSRTSILLVMFCTLAGFAARSHAWLPGHSSPEPISGLSVDAGDRTDVAMFFQTVYMASEQAPASMNWTGNVSGCSSGTTSAVFKDHTLRRVNWYRAMTGTPADVTFDSSKNTKAQQAALMMAAQNSLSHSPGSGWACYTAGGAEAAGRGNLALGSSGPQAINQYIRDAGSNNTAVGHRRWILSPRVVEMGTGDIPSGAGHNAANCLWVIGDSRSPTPPDQASYWPPKGFVPWQTVWERWSYSYPGANFASANVSMTKDGVPVPLTVESRTANGYGDNTIVFNAPSTVGPVSEDTKYTVTITGISNSGPTSVTYDVTVIDPNKLGTEVVISGPAQANSSGQVYQFTPIPGAANYEVSVSGIAPNGT
ncbi:MAG: CAP domain-containing protein, partial [Verrucomicrobiales bacterium]